MGVWCFGKVAGHIAAFVVCLVFGVLLLSFCCVFGVFFFLCAHCNRNILWRCFYKLVFFFFVVYSVTLTPPGSSEEK